MKSLILYYSKYGSTEKVAKKIATKIKNFDLCSLGDFNNPLDNYDVVYLGCPIYYGKMNKAFKNFVKKNKAELAKKDVRFYLLGIDDKNYNKTIHKNIDRDVLLNATIVHIGGAYDFEKMSFIDRFITKRVSRFDTSVDLIQEEKINELIKK